MSQQLQILINQVILFATLIVIGYASEKKGYLKDSDIDALSTLCVKVMIPAMIISVIVNGGSREALFSAFPVLLGAACLIIGLMVIGYISALILKIPQPTRNIHTCIIGFSNSGFMGFPMLLAMFGDRASIFVAAYIIADAALLWTLVPILADPSNSKGIDFKKLISPNTIAAVLGIVMVILNIKPTIVPWTAITAVGDSSKYIAMIYIGADLGRKGILKLFNRPIVFSIIPIKLIIAPIIVYLIYSATGVFDSDFVMMFTVIAMLPCMVAVAMIARNCGSDDEYASAAVLVTTIASILTMPIITWVIEKLFVR